jgi:hypothetical protein
MPRDAVAGGFCMSVEYSVPSKDADFDAHYNRVVEYVLA